MKPEIYTPQQYKKDRNFFRWTMLFFLGVAGHVWMTDASKGFLYLSLAGALLSIGGQVYGEILNNKSQNIK